LDPNFIAGFSPFSNAISGLGLSLNQFLIQTFASELSIGILDLAVLHGNAMQSGPSQEGTVLNSISVRTAIG
jgi:hypothetical protein